MRKLLLTVMVFHYLITATAQTDTALLSRLTIFTDASKRLDFEKIMDYTYPELFTLAPRDQMTEMLKKSFDNPQMKIGIYAVKTDSVYPVFIMQDGHYAKIKYTVKMFIQLKNKDKSDNEKKEMNENMLGAVKSQYGANEVDIDSTGTIKINMHLFLVAAKDQYTKEWRFANLRDDDTFITKIFSKELLDKLATYK